MESKKCHCPKCGSDNLQTIVKTNVHSKGKDFSASKGCCGAFIFGPIGLLCGACGKGKQITTTNTSMFVCNDCGHEFKKREDLVEAVETAKKMKTYIVPIVGVLWAVLFFILACTELNLGLSGLICLAAFGISSPLLYYMYKKLFDDAEAELNEYDKQQKKYSDEDNEQKTT